MRLRNVPGAREVMVENEYVFTEPEGMCGTWKEVFGNDNPIHIEIGMGKGTFITTLAGMNPDINYVGIEKYSSVLLRAVEKQDELQLPNLRLMKCLVLMKWIEYILISQTHGQRTDMLREDLHQDSSLQDMTKCLKKRAGLNSRQTIGYCLTFQLRK